MKSRFRGVFIAGLVIVGLGGLIAALAMGDLLAAGSWRYKMTVVVETPEGIKTGSAVREVSVKDNPKITPETIPHIEIKGEAVAVDLGARGVLFALLKNYRGTNYAHNVVYRTIGGNLSPEGIRFLQNATGKKAVLEPRRYPMLVMFRDITDPKTVTPVLEFADDGSIKADYFEELFGKGVKLKEISIEITDEPVTWGIKKIRPSYGAETGFMDWFNSLPYGDPRKIGPYDFFKGEK